LALNKQESAYAVRKSTHQAILRAGAKSLLGHLDFELTERCNNNCIHCCINRPADDIQAEGRELETAEIVDILRQAAKLGCMSVRFTGGEPLLRKDFPELYLTARKLGIKVIIFTNATLLDGELCDLLARIPPLERIEVTLYGMDQKTYEAVTRSPGSFDKAWRGIQRLSKKGIPFVVKWALLPQNRHQVKRFESWAEKIPWMDHPPGYSLFFNLRCRRDSIKKNQQIKRLRMPPKEGLAFVTRSPRDFHESMQEFYAKFASIPGDRLLTCGAGLGGGCVDAYGRFQLCLLLRHPETVYDLKQGSLKEAILGFVPKIRDRTAQNPEYINRCSRCFLKGLCEQCPAKSWMENGSLDTPVEYLCEIAHVHARYLGLLEEGEMAWDVKDWHARNMKFARTTSPFSAPEEF
jgi:radical SAM protein with 4Fe4S-binding SPASM domain